MPTGIVVQCQNERSQHKNRAAAWKMLRAKMARVEEEKREIEQGRSTKTSPASALEIKFAITSCILINPRQRQPHWAIPAGSFHAVLDGDIQEFLELYLRLACER